MSGTLAPLLLIEDNPADAYLLQELLAESRDHVFRISHAASLEQGLEMARQQPFQAILLDLSLTDSTGISTLEQANATAGHLPIIVLTGLDREDVGIEAVRRGAQDYLVKGKTSSAMLIKSIHYAIERKGAQRALQEAHDELERKVKERTADLAATVDELEEEVRQRCAAEEELRQANRDLKMISDCNATLVRGENEQTVVQEVCRTILEVGRYRMAWVGYAQDDDEKSVRPVARVGFEEGYLERAGITRADNERGRGPTGMAVRTGQVCIGQDFLQDPQLAPWRQAALERGFRSSIALPLVEQGVPFGALTIYSSEPHAFDEKQVNVLRELADDLTFAIIALRNRSALRQQSRQLRELASELTLAEQRERRRLAEVLHDHLQQLLVAARFRMQILQRTKDPDLRQAVLGVDDLISQSIEVSRSLTGELSPPILHDGGLIPALEWLVLWMKEKHDLTVELLADESASPAQEDLTILLFQSVRELLFNVVKHANVKTARIVARQDDGRIEVTVSDIGAGFDPKRVRDREGSAGGFGLFSIRERLDLLGGKMEIDSAPGRGSRFCLSAPVKLADPDERAARTLMPQINKSNTAIGEGAACEIQRKVRVLLADDHLIVRQGLAQLLKMESDIAVIGEASDGQAAVEMTRQLLPDAVIMDVSMPKLTGIEATRIIHAEFPEMPVIGLSMFGESERGLAMREAGAVDYLVKSDATNTLVAAIRACLKTPRAAGG